MAMAVLAQQMGSLPTMSLGGGGLQWPGSQAHLSAYGLSGGLDGAVAGKDLAPRELAKQPGRRPVGRAMRPGLVKQASMQTGIVPFGGPGARQAKPMVPVVPLDAEKVAEIQQYVEQAGGAVPLGKLATEMPGVKKAQLEPHFSINMAPGRTGDYIVTAQQSRKRPREELLFQELEPLQPLDATTVQSICEFIASCGGSAALGNVAALFEGATKARLVMAGFKVRGPEVGELEEVVMLQTTPAEGGGQKKKKKKKEVDPNAPPPLPLDGKTLQAIKFFLQSCGGLLSLGKLTTHFEGLKKVQLEPHFQLLPDRRPSSNGDFLVSLGAGQPALADTPIVPVEPKRKKPKPRKDPDAPPPPALEQSKVEEITGYLQLCGGVACLGKLSTDFPGVKKAQLEPHFLLCGNPAAHLTVCLDRETALANGFPVE